MRLLIPLLVASCLCAQTNAQAQRAAQAKQLLASERFAEAAVIYGALAREIPNNPGLLLNYGMALHLGGQDAQAIAPLQAALKLNPAIPPALLFLAASYLRTGQPAQAISPLEKLLQLEPKHPEARPMLIDAALSSNQPSRALPHLEKLTQLEPTRAALWYELGRTYETLAADTFSALERAFPESGPMFALIAQTRSQSSQRKAAFFFYRKALAAAPKLRGLHAALAEIYRQNGNPEWAAQEEAAEAQLGKAVCTSKTPECEFLATRYTAVLALTAVRKDADSLYWRTRAYNSLAKQAFAKLNALPESAESYRLKAEAARDQGNHAVAVDLWVEALRLAPDNPAFERELAASLMASKRYADAQKLCNALLAAEPDAADLLHLQGDLYLAQQQAAEAIPFLEKALRNEPKMLPARASLARALLQSGNTAAALPHVSAALPIDSDGSLHFQLARAYQASGDTENAKQAMAKYQEIKGRLRQQDQLIEEELKITPPQ